MADPIDQTAPPGATPPSAPGSTAFVLGGSDEEWLGRLRAARRPQALGPLGSYELAEVVAQGGQGVVYRAVQPGTGRPVALKRLLAGSVAEGTARARFEREIRVDAALKHPNIVSVYGVEFVGDQPVLAMEWIDGTPIDAWAAGKPRDAILHVFLRLCDAVQHGHQRGVIHRDLKPSNILVDAADQPHVLDFGLARLTGDAAQTRAHLTASAGFVGTLAYAPPEQLRADPDAADVRLDVYALGCTLYRCLTGRLPFGETADIEALVHRICQTDPARASSIDPSLAGDLDAILDKALARDRTRRYPTVEALGADVRRHLAHEPVMARPASAPYFLGRFARRHLALVAGATTAILVLAGATTVTTALYIRAERDRALSASVYGFMHHVLTSVDARRGVTLEEALDKAAAEIEGAFEDRPMVEADVRDMIWQMYDRIGLYEKARAQLLARLSLLERALGPDDEETVTAVAWIGWMLYREYRFRDAVPWYRRALDGFARTLGPDHAYTVQAMTDLGLCLAESGLEAESEELQRRALAICEHAFEPGNDRLPVVLNNLARVVGGRESGREEAVALFRRSLEAQERLAHRDDAMLAVPKYHLARLLWNTDPVECERLLRSASEGAHRTLRAGHPLAVQCDTRLGEFLIDRDRLDEAEPVLRATLDAAREHLGPERVETMSTQLALGGLLTRRARYQEAEDLIRPGHAWLDHTLGPESHQARAAIERLVTLYDAWDKPDLADQFRALLAPPGDPPPP